MTNRDPGPLCGAYAAAWSARADLADAPLQLLYFEMHRAGLDSMLEVDNPFLEFVISRWEQGVSPREFERDLRRQSWLLHGRSLKQLASSYVDIFRIVKDMEWETVDRSWTTPPKQYRMLSRVWGGPRTDESELALRIDDSAREVLLRCQDLPSSSDERPGYWGAARAWLRVTGEAPMTEVMVGAGRVGWTEIAEGAWQRLRELEARRIYADGWLFVEMGRSVNRTELRCSLPRA